MVFRNSPAPLFLVERKGLEEVFLDTPDMYGQARAEFSWCWKYRVAPLIENAADYGKVLFVDCDSLALRNIDHLLEGEWDVRYQPERGKQGNGKSFNAFLTDEEMELAAKRDGANSGTLAVRGAIFHEVMEEWQRIDEEVAVRDSGFRDQASWNALLPGRCEAGSAAASPHLASSPAGGDESEVQLRAPWRAEPFPRGEVQFPGYLDPHYTSYTKAALTHNILPDTKEKIEFTFGLYMRTFYCDPTGLFFSMLEI